MFTDNPFAADAESRAAENKLKATQDKTTLLVNTTVNDAMDAKRVFDTPVLSTPSKTTFPDGLEMNGPHGHSSLSNARFYSQKNTDSDKQSPDNGKMPSLHV